MSKTLVISVGWVYNEPEEKIGFGFYLGSNHPANGAKGERFTPFDSPLPRPSLPPPALHSN